MGGDKGKGKGEGKARDNDVVYRRPSRKDRDRLKALGLWPPPKGGKGRLLGQKARALIQAAGRERLPRRTVGGMVRARCRRLLPGPYRGRGAQPRAQGQSESSGAGLAPLRYHQRMQTPARPTLLVRGVGPKGWQ